MLPAISFEWLAIVVAFVASMALGAVIYARPVLGNWWMKQVGLDPAKVDKRAAMRGLAIAAILAFVAVLATSLVMDWAQVNGRNDALLVGLVLGLGIGLPVAMVHPVFEGRPLGVALLYGAHHVAEFVLVAFILFVVGYRGPVM